MVSCAVQAVAASAMVVPVPTPVPPLPPHVEGAPLGSEVRWRHLSASLATSCRAVGMGFEPLFVCARWRAAERS